MLGFSLLIREILPTCAVVNPFKCYHIYLKFWNKNFKTDGIHSHPFHVDCTCRTLRTGVRRWLQSSNRPRTRFVCSPKLVHGRRAQIKKPRQLSLLFWNLLLLAPRCALPLAAAAFSASCAALPLRLRSSEEVWSKEKKNGVGVRRVREAFHHHKGAGAEEPAEGLGGAEGQHLGREGSRSDPPHLPWTQGHGQDAPEPRRRCHHQSVLGLLPSLRLIYVVSRAWRGWKEWRK